MNLHISSLKATSNRFSYSNVLPVKLCSWTCSSSSVNKTLGPCSQLSGLHKGELISKRTKGKMLTGKRAKKKVLLFTAKEEEVVRNSSALGKRQQNI